MSFWDYLFGEESPSEFDEEALDAALKDPDQNPLIVPTDPRYGQVPLDVPDTGLIPSLIEKFDITRNPYDVVGRQLDQAGVIGAPDNPPVPEFKDRPFQGPPMPPQGVAPPVEPPTPIVRKEPELPSRDEEMREFLQMYDEYFPQREPAPEYTEAEDYARDELTRAKKLAQLRFFGHVTQAGGPGWDNIGQGFLAYADTMDTGHQRFLKTLDQAAAKDQAVSDQQYNDQVQRTATAFDLYNNAQRSKVARQKEARLARKDKVDRIDKYFKTLFDNAGGEFGIEDSVREKLEKRWRRSRDVGEIIDDFDDVRS